MKLPVKWQHKKDNNGHRWFVEDADGEEISGHDVVAALNASARPEALCNDWVKDAARSTNARVWGCTNDAIPDETVLDSPISLHHVTEMLGKIVRGEITGTKAHRWLGWAQAIICVGGGATLDELKAINKAASDALSARSPLARSQGKADG